MGKNILPLLPHHQPIHLDKKKAILTCHASILLKDVLNYCIPQGFSLAVIPGTQHVTLGGMIAADVHGKNHFKQGSIGNWVASILLKTSNKDEFWCSNKENTPLFNATIGGMGQTGLMLKVKLKLSPIKGIHYLQKIQIANSFEHLVQLMENATEDYKVAWMDLLNHKNHLLLSANEASNSPLSSFQLQKPRLSIPKQPFQFVRPFLMRFYNIYYFKKMLRKNQKMIPYADFFFPLDNIGHWNHLYGSKGLVQYQFVIPQKHVLEAILLILKTIRTSKFKPLLAVLKQYGRNTSPGLLSFPMEGYSMALDFNYSISLPSFLNQLDKLVIQYGGRIYLAKDSCLQAHSFEQMYPKAGKFKEIVASNRIFTSYLAQRLQLNATSKTVLNLKKPSSATTKHLLILGANSDIAKATAIVFYANNFSLTLASRNILELEKFCEEKSIKANIVAFNALDYSNHQDFYNSLPTSYSHVLCSFGYLGDNEKVLTNFDEATKILDTNFKGAVSILNIIASDFSHKKAGCIISISSVAADRGRASNIMYCAAKAGFESYLSGLRNHMNAFNVNIISIKPGFVASKMTNHLETPDFLTVNPEQVAQKIYHAQKNGKSIVYNTLSWRLIMMVIKNIPEFIFKRLKL